MRVSVATCATHPACSLSLPCLPAALCLPQVFRHRLGRRKHPGSPGPLGLRTSVTGEPPFPHSPQMRTGAPCPPFPHNLGTLGLPRGRKLIKRALSELLPGLLAASPGVGRETGSPMYEPSLPCPQAEVPGQGWGYQRMLPSPRPTHLSFPRLPSAPLVLFAHWPLCSSQGVPPEVGGLSLHPLGHRVAVPALPCHRAASPA